MPAVAAGIKKSALASCMLLAAQTAGAQSSDWRVEKLEDGNKESCVVVSVKQPVFDGYQQVMAWITVDDRTVTLRSQSVFDPSFSDVGFKLSSGSFVPIDGIREQRQAVFESQYSKLVQEFKRGREVSAQLRFWPTWPATGVHLASFSLIGFTKAYNEASACK